MAASLRRAHRAARSLHKARLTLQRAQQRIAEVEAILRLAALQNGDTTLVLGRYTLTVGETITLRLAEPVNLDQLLLPHVI